MPNFKQNITLLYDNKTGEFRESSERIKSVEWGPNFMWVTFKGNDYRYKYGYDKIIRERFTYEVDLSKSDVYVKDKLQEGLVSAANYSSYYCLNYERKRNPVYVRSENVTVKINSGKQILPYLKDVAGLIRSEDDGMSFLASQINKVELNRDTVLNNYLNGNTIIARNLPDSVIYPFSMNGSQKSAVKKALQHNISIIQGPPGTGKTQSILNLIANIVYNGKTVGIVSNNNSAVENVKEKLENKGYGFLMAHLGNNKNRERFIDMVNSPDYKDYKPESSWELKDKVVINLKNKVKKLSDNIDDLLLKKEELSQCKSILVNIKRESEVYYEKFGFPVIPDKYKKISEWNSKKIIDFKTTLAWFPERRSIHAFSLLIKTFHKFGTLLISALKEEGSTLSVALDGLIYDKRVGELMNKISKLERYIEIHDFDKMSRELSDLSSSLFNNYLFHKYGKTNLSNEEKFPVILSTTHSILNSVNETLDYIVIDESSQVDIITASLAFSACKNVVIVGDTRQLPHIVTDEIKDEADSLFHKHGISRKYDYVRKNIIKSLESVYGDMLPTTLLREHYRCDPLIIGFCNQKYYSGELITMTESSDKKYGSADYPIRLVRTAKGFHAKGNVNRRQIEVIENEILPQYKDVSPLDIGIISPYRKQADKIADNVCGNSGMESDTIHKFQGREKKKIIFSTVSNEITDFMDNGQLINVAVSRAIEQFTMVIPDNYETKHGSHIGDLIRYIEYWNPDGTVQSKIVSYFDLLNPGGHSESLNQFKLKVKGKSRFESENIIETLIRDVLAEDDSYSGIDIKSGYPLYLMIENKEGLNEREVRFCESRLAHVDFLLINRCDNSFVLAIEVDGFSFHTLEKQRERDLIKDKVLSMNDIKLLRLSTKGSREKEKIREKLKEIVSDS